MDSLQTRFPRHAGTGVLPGLVHPLTQALRDYMGPAPESALPSSH